MLKIRGVIYPLAGEVLLRNIANACKSRLLIVFGSHEVLIRSIGSECLREFELPRLISMSEKKPRSE